MLSQTRQSDAAPVKPASDDPAIGQTRPQAGQTPINSPELQTAAYELRPQTVAATMPRGRFGNYELIGNAMIGGMGVVYRARHSTLGRQVALKMLRSGTFAHPEEVQRFGREAQAAAQLNHPNVVPIYEVGEHAGQPFFTMPFLPGGSVGQHLMRFQKDVRAAVALMAKVACGVHYAHEKGILHRDLKPSNILLDERDEPMVTDFGLAKLMDSDLELTRSGQQLGTPAYMAPEQSYARHAEVTPRSDVWSLGVLLYELVTRRRPFEGPSVDEIFHKIRSEDPARPSKLRSEVDRSLETIILKCLEKDPARRYQNAGELADELGRWQRGEPILARPEGWGRRFRRFVRRNPMVAVAAVSIVVVAVGWAAYLHYTDPDRPLREIHAKLAKGEAATLIGEKGGPRWSRWVLGEGLAKVGAAGDGYFTVSTTLDDTQQLLCVLDDPQIDRYRIDVEIRHNSTRRSGVAGIIFGHRVQRKATASEHTYFEISFPELGRLAGSEQDRQLGVPGKPLPTHIPPTHSSLRLAIVRFQETRPGYGHKFQADTLLDQQFLPVGPRELFAGGIGASLRGPAADPRPGDIPWRHLAVEVTPDGVKLFWERALVGFMTRAQIVERSRYPLKGAPELHPGNHYLPRGAICLFSHDSSVSYRNLMVKPLP
jgi:hypothetical protein